MTRVPEPARALTSAELPTATMRSPAMATASAHGRAGSAVKTLPPARMRSGASAAAATPATRRTAGRIRAARLMPSLCLIGATAFTAATDGVVGCGRRGAEAERAQVDLFVDQPLEVHGRQRSDLVAGVMFDGLDRAHPHALAPRRLVRVAQPPVLLHVAVVAAEQAGDVLGG